MCKRNIVIVDVLSTGYNYVEDIVRRGYHPVVLETRILRESPERHIVTELYQTLHHQPTTLQEMDSFEETVEAVRSFDPLLILPGTETGVILANRLAAALSLPGNPLEYLDAMTKKDQMHLALKEPASDIFTEKWSAPAGRLWRSVKKTAFPVRSSSRCRVRGATACFSAMTCVRWKKRQSRSFA